MDNFVMVKNCFRKDLFKHYIEGFTDNHLLLLVYMQKFTAINRGEINFTMDWLFQDLEINKSSTRKELINSLFDLVDMELVELVDDVDRDKINKNTRIRTYAIEYEDNFTKIYDTEIDKIFDSDIDFRMKKTMLFLYCDIASRIDTKGYCYPSFESFKSDLDTTSDSRINDGLQMLKKNRLIDYDNVGQIAIGGQVQQGNNVYVLCCQEGYRDILTRGLANRKKQYEEGKATVTKKKQSNLQRSVARKWGYRLEKYHNGTITDVELKELEELEKEYWELIKDDIKLREKRLSEFVLFNPVVTKEMTTETKKHFGKPNPFEGLVNTETGEIIEDKTGSVNELNDNLDWLNGVEEKEKFWNEFEKKHNIKKEDTVDVINKYKPESLQFTEQQQNQQEETTDIEDIIDDLMS